MPGYFLAYIFGVLFIHTIDGPYCMVVVDDEQFYRVMPLVPVAFPYFVLLSVERSDLMGVLRGRSPLAKFHGIRIPCTVYYTHIMYIVNLFLVFLISS